MSKCRTVTEIAPTRSTAPSATVPVGSTNGAIGGVSASMAARSAASVAAVSGCARISQSAKTALPAIWSRCPWLSTTVNRRTPRSRKLARTISACGHDKCVS